MMHRRREDSAGLQALTAGTAAEYEHRMQDMVGRIAEQFRTRDSPATGTSFARLRERVESLDLDGAPLGPEELAREIHDLVLDEAVWFHHPDYLAHLNCPVDLNAVVAEAALAAVNTSVDTFDQSRMGTLLERRVLAWAAGRIGWPEGDGIFTSGGTQSNLHALFLGREKALEGLTGESRWEAQRQLVLFAGAESHFSVEKSALLLGLPEDAVVRVAVDGQGRMDPDALRDAALRARAAGRLPLAVSATAGTTDRGRIDPLPRLAEVCAELGLRLHVDAAYGGGLLVSRAHRHLLAGLERADSVTVDFHKTFFQPVSSSALLLRDPADFRCGSWHPEYLNPREAEEPNQVDKSLQTTRRFDALKLYATLRGTGADAVGQALDHLLATTRAVHAGLREHPSLRLLSGTDLSTALFRWQPEGVDDVAADALVPRVREELQRSGELLLARTVLEGRPCLKITLLNPATEAGHVLRRLDEVAALAARLHGAEEPAPVPDRRPAAEGVLAR